MRADIHEMTITVHGERFDALVEFFADTGTCTIGRIVTVERGQFIQHRDLSNKELGRIEAVCYEKWEEA